MYSSCSFEKIRQIWAKDHKVAFLHQYLLHYVVQKFKMEQLCKSL